MDMAFFSYGIAHAQLNMDATRGLIERILPDHSSRFEIEYLPGENNSDIFEIESLGDKIVLRGSNGVAIGSALNYYLKNFCNSEISWNGSNLDIPVQLPKVKSTIRKNSPYKYRYYLNYTTYNYTMTWWDWERWEKEIDWMALNGINMPLAITGQNAIWQRVYRSMGFTDEDLKKFFSGPAYSAFNWMGLLDGYGGPLPQRWIDDQEALQKKIVERQRSLGMTPILPAFTGHVPPGFSEKFPEAKLQQVQWTVFPEADILDPNDSLFAVIGEKFIAEQKKAYGTDHLYTADAFIEVRPPSNDSIYLSDMSRNIYQSMAKADPEAKWIMQGWMFYFLKNFLGKTQIQALLNAVPDDNMIILDLWSEVRPIWQRTEAYYGKPWLWCMVHNFGGHTALYGKMPVIAKEPAAALNHPESGNMAGIGLTMEGIEQNPAVYALMLENTWREDPIDLDKWISSYIMRRYGERDENASEAWEVLKNTVYGYTGDLNSDGSRSMVTMRPTFATQGPRSDVHSFYNPEELLPAWKSMVNASRDLQNSEGFQYDITDVTRQVLANYADELHKKYVTAYEDNNIRACKKYSERFLAVIGEMDRMVLTNKHFLLGQWLEDAKERGTTAEEKELYEWNARNILTMWHGKDGNRLNDYAWRHWAGLLNNYYIPRWKQFFDYVENYMKKGREPDMEQFREKIAEWEWNWVNSREEYAAVPKGNSSVIAKKIYSKYYKEIQKEYAFEMTELGLCNF
jgi:alpha-N-acetylglucosaminidase